MGADRRVIGVLAHVDAGKTTISEQLLHVAGEIGRPGAVERGNTVTDWLEDEQERGITITSAAAGFTWRGVAVDLVDTPGHVDFSVEVERVLRVLDGAILVVSAPAGVQAQTEAIWRALRQERIPTLVVINKLDQPHLPLDDLLARVSERLDVPLAVVQWPEYEDTEDAFVWYGHWDLPELAWCPVDEDGRRAPREPDADPGEDVRARREALVERLAEFDDRVMIQYLESASPGPALLHDALREATAGHRALPVVFCMAAEGLGIEALLDAALAWLPAPEGSRSRLVYDAVGEGRDLAPGAQDGLLANVFKTESRGDLVVVHVRVFEDVLSPDEILTIAGRTGKLTDYRVARLLGREIIDVARLDPGAVGALILPSDAPLLPHTGDTLGSGAAPDWAFERPQLLLPVVWATFEASDAGEHGALEVALRAHVRDDPSLALAQDPATGQLLVGGRGELHLEVLHRRLARSLGGPERVRIGAPRVRRRARLAAPATGQGRAEAADGVAEVVATAWISPAEGEGTVAIEAPEGGASPVPETARAAIVAGIQYAFADGVAADLDQDLPAVRVRVVATEGAIVSPIVYREAAIRAIRQALADAPIEIFVPYVEIEATVPHDNVGRFHAELQRRGLPVMSPSDTFGAFQVFRAEAPLAPLLGFAATFRTLTNGRGHWAIRPAGLRAEPPVQTNSESA